MYERLTKDVQVDIDWGDEMREEKVLPEGTVVFRRDPSCLFFYDQGIMRKAKPLESVTAEHDPDWRFEPFITYCALHTNFLVVAVARQECAWKAYGVPVPGMSHEEEARSLWRRYGSPIPHEDAMTALFPRFSGVRYAQ